jgi:microcystin-dependent protein
VPCIEDTDSVDLTISEDNLLSADVNVSLDAGNGLSIHADGLYAPYPWLPGEMKAWPTGSAPTGWLLCDGSAVNRSTYAALFAVIGTTFGIGDGSVTFNLPDAQGRALVGKGTNTDCDAIGDNEGVSTVANRSPRHNSTVVDPGHGHSYKVPQGNSGSTDHGFDDRTTVGDPPIIYNDGAIVARVTGVTVGPGGTRPVDTPAFLTVNWIIRT